MFKGRIAICVACIVSAFVSVATGQNAPSGSGDGVLMIRISVDGICYFLDTSAPCEKLGSYLRSMNLAQDGHVHIAVDKSSKYELVAATLKSLDGYGFKVGFVNVDLSH
jgi:biopolymer transport protein ExbD